MNRNWEQCGPPRAVAVAVCLAALSSTAWSQAGGLTWSLESDGSWNVQDMGLGNHGTQVFQRNGDYHPTWELYSGSDSGTPAAIWRVEESISTRFGQVASAAAADLHVTLHQEDQDGSPYRRAVVTCFRSGAEAPIWSHELPVDMLGPFQGIDVSRDGTRVVATVYDTFIGETRVTTFGAESAVPTAVLWVDTFGYPEQIVASDDGSTLAILDAATIHVIDLGSMQEVDQLSVGGTQHTQAFDLSGDGSRIGFGTLDEVRVYRRQAGGGYQSLMNLDLPGAPLAEGLDFSSSGTHLVVGARDSSTPDLASVYVFDAQTGSLGFEVTYTSTGPLSNQVAALRLSDEGRVLAVGLTGDGGGGVEELHVYDLEIGGELLHDGLSGSVVSLSLSPDGDRVAVASLNGHGLQPGLGGAIRLYNTHVRDFSVEGVPCIGSTVGLVQRARAGVVTRTLASPQLAPAPMLVAGAGLLRLDRASTTLLPGAAVADTEGRATRDYSIPTDSGLVGSTLFLQGLRLGPRELSRDWEALTVLP